MSPLVAWLSMLAGSLIYHGMKHAFGLPPTWPDFWGAFYWTGWAMLIVQLGWVRSH